MHRWNFKHAGIENSEEYINQSEEKIKQDCESKAFVRLAKKIKESFLRLPIIITADGLYVSQNEIIFQNTDVNLIYYTESPGRWKIENQGFNRQKHWQGNIEHACSWNEQAQMNHYLMEQIADFIKQLYEYYYLKKNEIKKLQKNISPELLASFGRQLTKTEDIKVELHNAVLN